MQWVNKLVVFVVLLSILNIVSATTFTINSTTHAIEKNGSAVFPLIMFGTCGYITDTLPGVENCSVSLSKMSNFDYSMRSFPVASNDANWVNYWNTAVPIYESNNVWFDAQGAYWDRPNMNKWRNYSTFFGYYVDETETGENYKAIKAGDSNHPVIASTYLNFTYVSKFSDIISFNAFWHRSNNPTYNISNYMFVNEYELWRQIITGCPSCTSLNSFANKSIVIMHVAPPEEWHDGSIVFERETPQEMRAEAYWTIITDAKGLAYWSYKLDKSGTMDVEPGTLYNNQTHATLYNELAGEIQSLEPIILLPTLNYSWGAIGYGVEDNRVNFTPNPTTYMPKHFRTFKHLSYSLKKSGNIYYLFVVNKASTPVNNVVINISVLSGSMTATVLGNSILGYDTAGRTLSVTNGVFTDSFQGFSGRAYKIESVNPMPAIVLWGNTKTNNDLTSFSLNNSESVSFNVTTNQTIANWSWYNDGQTAGNNTNSYTVSFLTGGTKNISVSATNANGTSNMIAWTVYVPPTSNVYPNIGIGGIPFGSNNSNFNHTILNKGDGKVTVGLFADNCNDGTSDWIPYSTTWSCINGSLKANGNWVKQSLSHPDVDFFAKFRESSFQVVDLGLRADTSRNSTSMQYYFSGRSDGTNISIVYYNGLWYSNQMLFSRSLNNWTYAIFKVNGNTQEGYISTSSFNDAISSGVKLTTAYNDYVTGNYIRLTANTAEFDDVRVIEHNRFSGSINVNYDAGANNQSNGVIINVTTPADTNYTVSYRQKDIGTWIIIGGVYIGNQTLSITGTKYQDTEINITLFGNGTSFPDIETIEFIREQAAASNVYPRYDVDENGIVDMDDLTLVGQYFNEIVSIPFPRYDVNIDGLVNIDDITIVGQHFGEKF